MKENYSPIVTPVNQPKSLQKQEKSMKKATYAEQFVKLNLEALLEEMKKAGGKNLVTEQFAVLITSKVKKSEDEARHHLWDLALAHVRTQMRKLEAQGRITMSPIKDGAKLRYEYSVVE
jgi:hypothetical protein